MRRVRGKALAAVIAFCAAGLPIAVMAAHELDNRDITNGADLYQEHCASCHGVNLEGEPNWQRHNADGTLPAPPHDETGHTWHHDNQLLFAYTWLGGERALAERGVTGFKSAMPGFSETLNQEEVWDILGYIQSTWPRRVQEVQVLRNPPHTD